MHVACGRYHLMSVSQSGQPRAFIYDTLKKLAQASNPESGASADSRPKWRANIWNRAGIDPGI